MVVLSVDQSYKRCGFAVAEDGKPLLCTSVNLAKKTSRKEKRTIVRNTVVTLANKFAPDYVVIERVRTFSKNIIAINTIIALSQLVTAVVDASAQPVYSCDTRSWKAAVLGNASASKQDAINFATKFGYDVDDDAADALCMALYAFTKEPKWKEEK